MYTWALTSIARTWFAIFRCTNTAPLSAPMSRFAADTHIRILLVSICLWFVWVVTVYVCVRESECGVVCVSHKFTADTHIPARLMRQHTSLPFRIVRVYVCVRVSE